MSTTLAGREQDALTAILHLMGLMQDPPRSGEDISQTLKATLQALNIELTVGEICTYYNLTMPMVGLRGRHCHLKLLEAGKREKEENSRMNGTVMLSYHACVSDPCARSFSTLGRVLAEGLQWGPLSAAAARGLELAKREGSAMYQAQCAALGFLAARNRIEFCWEEVRSC